MSAMQMSILSSLSDTGGRSPVDAWVVNLAGLRDEGFRRVWMTQMPYEPDLLTALGIVLREVDTLEVATGVVPIQVQHPMQLAQRALTLSLIGDGRFILGLGMSHRVVTEQMWGISFDKPVRRMREYLDGLLPLLAGEPADAVGETVSTRGRTSDSGRADSRRVHRGDGAADAAARGQALGGHRHLDDRTQDVGRARRADAA